QALGEAPERDRADREELLLHVARQTRLREECRIGVIDVAQQRLLNRRNVVDALGKTARQFLEARKAVEFQRIKFLFARLQLRLDLRLGLDLDLAHLRSQTYNAIRELEQVALERTQLALDARAGDCDFAGLVDQPIDQVGAHAKHRARSAFAL